MLRFFVGLLLALATLVVAAPSPAFAAGKGVVISPASGAVLVAGEAVAMEATASGVCSPELVVTPPGGQPVLVAAGSGGALCTGAVTLAGTYTPEKSGTYKVAVMDGEVTLVSRDVGATGGPSPAVTATARVTVTATPPATQQEKTEATPSASAAPTVTVTATPKPKTSASSTARPRPTATVTRAAAPVRVVVTTQPAPVAAAPAVVAPVLAPPAAPVDVQEPVVLPTVTVTPVVALGAVQPVASDGSGIGLGTVVLVAVLAVVGTVALGGLILWRVLRVRGDRHSRS
uniref:hypothetical protein n=1 Tax=Streptosporangium sp. CA-235898 TaxID=3240073 RepID=UPI003F498EE2